MLPTRVCYRVANTCVLPTYNDIRISYFSIVTSQSNYVNCVYRKSELAADWEVVAEQKSLKEAS